VTLYMCVTNHDIRRENEISTSNKNQY
jgi:hypothetical protein